MKTIKVLGPGCANCKRAIKVVEKVIKESALDVQLEKVEEMPEIMKYNVLSTPALVVDEVVKMTGRVPSKKEVKQLLAD
ncbi:MAG: thioredoxin family protein [Bacteroidota bacterium]